jgi:RNA polymerase sigma-70 factor (ECF subfamily)
MTIPSTSETSGTTSLNLLDRIRVREPEGWRQFVKLYTPLVYYWCRKAGLPAVDAAAVSHEVFRSVLSHVAEHRHSSPGDTLRGWLFAVTRSKLADHFRKAKATSEASRSGDASKSSESSRAGESSRSGDSVRRQFQMQADAAISDEHKEPRSPAVADLVRRALQLLQSDFEPGTWKAFWRVTVDGQAPAEVAAELKISTNAVYQAKSRVLSRLRDELGDRLG